MSLLSGIMQNTACLRSPSFESSMPSKVVMFCISGRVKAARRTAALTNMLLAVLPAACLKIRYWRRAMWFGFSSSKAAAPYSIMVRIISIVCSSGGASCSRYSISAASSAVSDFSQNGSFWCAFFGVVFWMKLFISLNTSLSRRM